MTYITEDLLILKELYLRVGSNRLVTQLRLNICKAARPQDAEELDEFTSQVLEPLAAQIKEHDRSLNWLHMMVKVCGYE